MALFVRYQPIGLGGGGGGGGINAIGTIDSITPSADGAAISGQSLIMQSASVSVPGLVNNTTQGFNGDKTFNNKLIVQSQANGTPALEILCVAGASHPTFFMTGRDSSFLVFDNIASTAIAMAISYTGQVGIGTTPNGNAQLDVRAYANEYGLQLFNPSSLPQDFLRAYDGSNALMINFTAAGAGIFTGSLTAAGASLSAALNMNSHLINNVTDPAAAQDAATKAYVDAAVAALNPADACFAASTANIAGTYLNGVAGIGATFTTTATGVFTIDGVTPALGARILIKDQSSGLQNGVYNITTLGALAVSTVFTRALDYNTASEMNTAGLIPIQNGTLNALSSWQQTAIITTVGTDALVFQEFTANPSLYVLKANNLSDVANKTTSFNNLSPMTTGGDLIYGGASGSGTRLANGSAGQFLASGGGTAAPVWTTLLPLANGGTGQGTKAAAFDALQPMSASGDIIYGGTSGTGTRLAKGADGTVLTLVSGLPAWTAASSGTVTSVAASGPAGIATWSAAVTTSGTLTQTLSNQNASLPFIGPAFGASAAAPTFRAFVPNDISTTIQSKSTTYTVLATDDQVFASGASWTATLPSASTVPAGKRITFIHNDSTVGRQYTIAGGGGDTINGLSSTTVDIRYHTKTVESDGGTGWTVVSDNYPQVWTSYTPTFAGGYGTVTGITFYWRKEGDSIHIRGSATTGTTTNPSAATITIPSGIPNINVIGSAAMICGTGTANVSSSANVYNGVLAFVPAASTTTIQFCNMSTGSSQNLSGLGAGQFIGNSTVFSVDALIPITGWH